MVDLGRRFRTPRQKILLIVLPTVLFGFLYSLTFEKAAEHVTPETIQNHTITSDGDNNKTPYTVNTLNYAPPEWISKVGSKLSPRLWQIREDPLPCLPPTNGTTWFNEFDPSQSIAVSPQRPGFFFIKPVKVGGSTVAGIQLRLMHNLPQRLFVGENQSLNGVVCRGNFRHGPVQQLYPEAPLPGQVFWTVLRDPTARAVSYFWHMHVSRQHVPVSDRNFAKSLQNYEPSNWMDDGNDNDKFPSSTITWSRTPKRPNSHYVHILGRKGSADEKERLASILPNLDFVLLLERLDESLVVLKYLWKLEWGDLFYLSAKENGGYDGGGSESGCTYIQPHQTLTSGMESFVRSSAWLDRIQDDFALYVAANQSLDRTIDKVIEGGRERVARDVQRLQGYQRLVQEECGPKAIFPCSLQNNTAKTNEETNCLWKDSACAYECINEVAARILVDRD